MEQITVKELSKKIRDKKDFYEVCMRNGYYLPALKSSIVNEAYLINVMGGTYYCPKLEEVRLKACPRPPHKQVLIAKFLKVMEARGSPHGLVHTDTKKLVPDKKWLIDVLSTLKPDDEIFNKDYLPPPRTKNIEEQKTVNMPRDFLLNIPDSRSKAKSRRLKLIGEGQIKQRVQYMKQVVKSINDQIIIQEMRAEKMRASQKAMGTDMGSTMSAGAASAKDGGSKKASSSANTSINTSLALSSSQPQVKSQPMQMMS